MGTQASAGKDYQGTTTRISKIQLIYPARGDFSTIYPALRHDRRIFVGGYDCNKCPNWQERRPR